MQVNYSGKKSTAIAINQSIPGPKLVFNVGDTAVIKVTNKLTTNASIHWHGLLLPQDQDGVPYITYFPIEPGASFTYRFPITHAGTYWYHSHTNIDEQRGQYGSIVIHDADTTASAYDYDEVIQLSDWTDEDPKQVLNNLKKSGDWYAYQKDSVVSIKGYIDQKKFSAWLANRWQRMEGMDVSDVAYDAFLANGKKHLTLLKDANPGDKVRLRFINSGASSYFAIEQSNAPFTIIAADGTDVQPVTVQSFQMGMAETYDVIVTIPESGAVEINANNIDGTGYAKITLGDGITVAAPLPTKPDLYQTMSHQGHNGNHKGHNMAAMMDHSNSSSVEKILSYKMLKTTQPTSFAGNTREIQLDLTGDMESYNWSFNNQILSNADKIKISRGEIVRFVFNNKTMMRHPLHLHGHFFKVISGNGDFDVLKHTVDVGPMAQVTIEFLADAEKDWFFHCHNLYHAKTGMARVVRYSDYDGNDEFNKAMRNSTGIRDTDWFSRSDIGAYTNYARIDFRYSNYRYAAELEAERSDWDSTELELSGLWRAGRWSQIYIAANYETIEDDTEYKLGVRYHAPFNIELDSWLNDEGEVNIGFETAFPLTNHWQLVIEADTEKEYAGFLNWRNSPRYSVGIGVTEDTSLAIGVSITF
jgi:FtsP/CotA-like multicopper oxidase with cupredoxin domain